MVDTRLIVGGFVFLLSFLRNEYLSNQSSNELRQNRLEILKIQRIQKKELLSSKNQIQNTIYNFPKNIFYQTVGSGLRMRNKPSITQSRVLVMLPKNVKVLFLERRNQWVKCEYFDRQKQSTHVGWIHIRKLKRMK